MDDQGLFLFFVASLIFSFILIVAVYCCYIQYSIDESEAKAVRVSIGRMELKNRNQSKTMPMNRSVSVPNHFDLPTKGHIPQPKNLDLVPPKIRVTKPSFKENKGRRSSVNLKCRPKASRLLGI